MILRNLFLALLLHLAVAGPVAAGEGLPSGFVHLRSVDPTISQAIRYAGVQNFTGARVPGYEADECILTRQAAAALIEVQHDLSAKGLGLKIFDCYRPARAVAAFVLWAGEPEGNPELKARYYPAFKKPRLFDGYIASRSGHSRGSTVDLTIVEMSGQGADEYFRDGCVAYEQGPELDMGTGFDCLDPRSNTNSLAVSEEARKNRGLLVAAMRRRGFRNYAGEWWHFTLINEPHRRTYFDFPVVAPDQ